MCPFSLTSHNLEVLESVDTGEIQALVSVYRKEELWPFHSVPFPSCLYASHRVWGKTRSLPYNWYRAGQLAVLRRVQM